MEKAALRWQTISDPEDARIAAYRSLRTRTESGEAIRIADGRRVLVNLMRLQAPIRSILCEEHGANSILERVKESPGAPPELYVASARVLERIVGYRYHRGVMAELAPPELAGLEELEDLGERIVVLCGLDKGENVGAVIRNCAAFGVRSLVVDSAGATPFQRNAIRVSRGFVYGMKIHVAKDLPGTLRALQAAGYTVAATNQSERSVPFHRAAYPRKLALLLGNEGHGVSREIETIADLAITIPMAPGSDSLNVAAASAVILSHLFNHA